MSLIFRHSISKILSPPINHSRCGQTIRLISFFKKAKAVQEAYPYIIVRATMDDFPEILTCMHDSYYGQEPTVASLNIKPNAVMDEKTIKAMSEGYTLVAKCKYDGKIVGACISESSNPWDPDMDEKLACSIQSVPLRQLILFNAYVNRAPDLWRCLGVQKVYAMDYLFIKASHRKQGLAFKLLEEAKALGSDAGFSVIKCDATSLHTAKICERLGMQKVAEIPYCSYLDNHLQPIFKPPWPHESVKIYCDCAPQANELKKKLKKRKFIFGRRKNTDDNHDI